MYFAGDIIMVNVTALLLAVIWFKSDYTCSILAPEFRLYIYIMDFDRPISLSKSMM